MKPNEANDAHMERVRAVHRRSAWERVLSKIASYEMWERGSHDPDVPPLTDHERDQLRCLRELREVIRQEMIDAGQLQEPVMQTDVA